MHDLAGRQAQAAQPLVALAGLSKAFAGVRAVETLDLAIQAGEVHVLLGENGAGKSTVVALLSGFLRPDRGTILVNGLPVAISSPRHARRLGIGTVFQHAMLVPTLTVAQNVALGGAWWQAPALERIARDLNQVAARFGLAVDPNARVASISLGERQQIEIARALTHGSRILLLDEATSMLTPAGVIELGALMRRLAAGGLGIVFITHRLSEAKAFGDRVTVLRAGRKVGELTPSQLAALGPVEASAEMVRLMFGSSAVAATARAVRETRPAQPPVLVVERLGVADQAVAVCDANFAVSAGEVFGIAGIDGNGQRQLAEALSGQRPVVSGRILLDGTPLERASVAVRYQAGLRYVTDDRLAEGTIPLLPISTNLLLKEVGRPPFWRTGISRPARARNHAATCIAAFDIRAPGPATPVGRLSGGNIQKVILARELSGNARAVIYAKPTNGLDARTTAAMRGRIRDASAKGVATVIISTDLDELVELCDRIAVMRAGRLLAALPNDADARARVGAALAGALAA